MSPRYLLIVRGSTQDGAELAQRFSIRTGLSLAYSNERVVALINSACRCIAVEQDGCILGSLFHRHGPAEQLLSLSPAETASIASSDGQVLLRTFWGGYVAAISGPDSVRILRDP